MTLTVKTILAAGGVERIEMFRAEHGADTAAEVALQWALNCDTGAPGSEIDVDFWLATAVCCEALIGEPVSELHPHRLGGGYAMAIDAKQDVIARILDPTS